MDSSSLSSLFLNNFEFFGILACVIVMAGLVIPIPFYYGRDGERYSVLNHFVSELGEVGVSKGAGMFNGCLIAAGGLFIPFTLGLGLSIDNWWAKLGMATGLCTAVSLLLIGVFSMDKLEPHVRAALSFFDAGFFTIILFTIGIWLQPAGTQILPKAAGWIGVLCILVYSVFLVGNPRPPAGAKIADFLRPDLTKQRPRIWSKPIMEWLVVLMSTLWYLSTGLIIAMW